MFGSELLDVVIGMVFIFLLLSLICSALNELLETRLKNRARDLEKGITGLLGNNTGLVDKLYNHGLIFSLYRGSYEEASKKRTLPSYIPSQDFANALASILGPDSGAVPSADDIRSSISKIQNPQVKSALQTLFNDAGNDLQKFRRGMEGWFNSAMDRVSGWYKRRTHVIIFALGFLIAVTLNVNSISLAQDLWANKATRDALVGAAQSYLEKHPASTSANPSSGSSTLDLGLKADLDELKSINLPIGWTRKILNDFYKAPLLWFAALLGWFLTAAGASLGAPFWFDLLSKIVILRSSITPGQKTTVASAKS
jgi:hypothetical protein